MDDDGGHLFRFAGRMADRAGHVGAVPNGDDQFGAFGRRAPAVRAKLEIISKAGTTTFTNRHPILLCFDDLQPPFSATRQPGNKALCAPSQYKKKTGALHVSFVTPCAEEWQQEPARSWVFFKGRIFANQTGGYRLMNVEHGSC